MQSHRLLADFLLDPSTAKRIVILLISIAIYVAGILIRIPTIRPAPTFQDNWWFLMLFDQVFTGGAFGRGAFLCLGLFATLALGGAPAPAGKRTRQLLWRIGKLGFLSAVAIMIFVVRGAIPLEFRAIGLALVSVAVGGVVIAQINRTLARNKGPQIVHINIVFFLFLYYRHLWEQLQSTGGLSGFYLVIIGMIVTAVSAHYILQNRIYIDVQNIKSLSDRRSATLELRGINEESLDLLAFGNVTLFVSIAGALSLLAGWREMAAENFLPLALISIAVLISIWLVLILAGKILAEQDSLLSHIGQLLDTGEMLALQDPRRYVNRMINNFWIVPGIAIGKATENFIRAKLKRSLTKSFLIFAVCFLIILGIQSYGVYFQSGVLLFPYGPLVFMFLFLMCVGNLSMITRNIKSKFSHQRQMAHGKSRIMAKGYLLPAPDKLRHLDLGEGDTEYWDDEKLGDQVQQVVDWYRLMVHAQAIPSRSKAPRKTKLVAIVSNVVIGIMSGVIMAFIGGLLYVIFVPQRGDVWQLMIPLFVAGLLSPNVLWTMLKRRVS